jgi:fumarate reductase subunit D
MKKRSNAPIYWSLFGAGGMLSALVGPGVAAALLSAKLDYAHASAFAHNFVGKAFLFAIASLFLWHAAHRIFHALHDLGIKPGIGSWLLLYGVALGGTIVSASALSRIGF